MNTKVLVWIGIFAGSTIGGLIPTLWGAEVLSFSAILGSLIGGLLGIWVAYKISQRL